MSTELERQTRKRRIDPRLARAGWSVVPFRGSDPSRYESAAVEEFETDAGPADYALCVNVAVLGPPSRHIFGIAYTQDGQ
jgi:type I restriction enzyme R subunit